MAAKTLSGSILTLLGFLAVFAVNSIAVTGQSQGASFNIVNDGAPGSILATGVKVHCYNNGPVNLPVATLLPGQSLYQTWPLISYLDDIYKCDFELDASSGTLRQSFEVWKQEQGNVQNFLNGCDDCKWSIVPDGFYWRSDRTSTWVREYVWTS